MVATRSPTVLIGPRNDGTDPAAPCDLTDIIVYGTYSTAKKAWTAAIELIQGEYATDHGRKLPARFELDAKASTAYAYWKFTKKHGNCVLRRANSPFFVRTMTTSFNRLMTKIGHLYVPCRP